MSVTDKKKQDLNPDVLGTDPQIFVPKYHGSATVPKSFTKHGLGYCSNYTTRHVISFYVNTDFS